MGSRAPGSSPRVRGKLPRRAGQRTQVGLIPARAGKTRSAHRHASGRRAHPRACGENQGRGRVRPHPMGLIPARAGKTSGPAPLSSLLPAHPRACGENTGLSQAAARSPGSSPRVRGKPGPHATAKVLERLIPARAGKTPMAAGPACSATAHPRACGENFTRTPAVRSPGGSSPRVRGKLQGTNRILLQLGLIPARAGKTPARRASSRRRRAHPRACGENIIVMAGLLSGLGSSPRVRGKRPPLVLFGAAVGLIPARAGKTVRGGGACTLAPAHPRACGENLVRRVPGDEEVGSSPRVRGKPCGPGG